MTRRRVVQILAVALLLGTGGAQAATLRVPSEYATINAATDASAFGDTVLVAPGIYDTHESRGLGVPHTSVAFLRDGTTLLSEAGPDQTTLRLDGPRIGSPSAIHVGGLPSTKTVIDGFEFTGTMDLATGIWGEHSGKITVRNCRFVDMNNGRVSGGGVWAKDLSMDMEGCVFVRCMASAGGGLMLEDGTLNMRLCTFEAGGKEGVRLSGDGFDGPSRIEQSTFRNNGGPAVAVITSDATIENCWFEGNVGATGTGAVAASSDEGSVVNLYGSVFVNNAGVSGGAILWTGVVGQITGNTFLGNEAAFGAACLLQSDASLVFTENVFVGSAGASAILAGQPQPISGCNLFWNNSGGDAEGYTIQPTSILADPQFCNTLIGDFTVHSTSPCLPENSNGCGQIGAFGQGCGAIAVDAASWARIKGYYR